MKNKNLMVGLGIAAASVSAQAQTTIASVGFEASDSKYTTEEALTPDGSYGDWVNKKENDNWQEQDGSSAFSGEYGFLASNDESVAGNTWDRGFKVGNLQIKENTPYRVSFWIKAQESYIDDNGMERSTGLNAWLSQGIENYDKSFCAPSGGNYGVEMTKGFTGEWQRISFVSYYKNADVLNEVISKQDWVGNAIYPEDKGGDGTMTYAQYFNKQLPKKYFAIINMYSPVEYALDDIKIEEGVTFNQALFGTSTIRLDFGYPTNIAKLAEENKGSFSLDTKCVTVKINGKEVPVEFLEGKEDGFLYVFLYEDTAIDVEKDNVEISFAPAEDCPIIYSSDRRPSSDTESEMKVLGFTNEKAYFGAGVDDVLPASWSPATMVSCTPENGSFEIDAKTFKSVTVTFDKTLSDDFSQTSATLISNGKQTDLSNNLSLSEDKLSVIVAIPELSDGEYELILSGVQNVNEVSCLEDQKIEFAVGADNDNSQSESVYSTNQTFSETKNGTFPVGWLSNDNGTIHQYGLTDSGEVWDYNWGGNTGGGGCRAMTGYSGDLNGGAIYWRCMNDNNQLGTLTFGEQVKDFILADGTVDPEMDPNIALHLDAAKYQISIRMCAWKNLNSNTDAVNKDNAPKYNFTLEDLEGNIYARFDEVSAMPNVNGAQNVAVNNVTLSQADFTVAKAGYYILKFSTTQPNGEYLLGGVELITMPSKAAYYKQLLNAALASANNALEAVSESQYNGTTKTALETAISEATNGHFTCPSEVNAQISNLEAKAKAMNTRAENLNKFSDSVFDAEIAVMGLEEEENKKYLNAPAYIEVKQVVEDYKDVNPSTLEDDVLAEKSAILASAATKIANVKESVDILTFGAVKAGMLASQVDADALNVYSIATDDRNVINEVNNNIKLAIYNKIANKEDLSNLMTKIYDPSTEVEEIPVGEEDNYDEYGHPVLFKGIDLSSFVMNTHLYRVQGNTGVPGWTISAVGEGKSVNIAYNGEPSNEKPVVDAMINIYGDAEYNMSQEVENLPAGNYAVIMQTRTPLVNNERGSFYYNAQNDSTNVWDKYVYAQGDADAEMGVAPYIGGGSGQLQNSIVQNVTVKDGKMTLGAVEHYVSGKAVAHEDGEPRDFWTGTSQLDYVNIYYVSPLADFDYAKAYADDINNAPAAEAAITDIFSANGVRQNALVKGINIIKYSDGSVKKVIVK